MKRYAANTQLKLIFYLVLLGLGFYYVQVNYNLFKFENSEAIEQEKEAAIYLEKQNGERVPILVEIADDQPERTQGLMNREKLDENRGMLFIFEQDSINGFWMKDTKIPLDMIFLSSDLKVVAIEKEAQPCTETPCKIYNPGVVYRYVVEVNGGWSEKNGVSIGDSLDIRNVTSDS